MSGFSSIWNALIRPRPSPYNAVKHLLRLSILCSISTIRSAIFNSFATFVSASFALAVLIPTSNASIPLLNHLLPRLTNRRLYSPIPSICATTHTMLLWGSNVLIRYLHRPIGQLRYWTNVASTTSSVLNTSLPPPTSHLLIDWTVNSTVSPSSSTPVSDYA